MVETNVVDSDVTDAGGYDTFAGGGLAVCEGLPNEDGVSELNGGFCVLGYVELGAGAFVFGADEVLKHQIASLFSQQPALPIFIHRKMVESTDNSRIAAPGINLILFVYTSTRISSGTQLENPQSKPDIRVRNVVMDLTEGITHGTDIAGG